MVFSSILFLFRFLPAALLIYYLTPYKAKNLSLLILSLVFYSWGEPKYFIIMIASIFIDYYTSKLIDKNRDKKKLCMILLLISIIFNLGMLFFFKYINFFINNINILLGVSLKTVAITLPLGISFYTFQTMSYTIDVYRGKVTAEKNIINFGAYVCLFPQLIAGPIVKYTDVEKELKNRYSNLTMIEEGIELFILGLGKKVLIANNIGVLWNEVERIGFNNLSTPMAWMGIVAFSFQIYFDFSGYSLMAIGIGKMLGFNFPQNFNFPYISRSITEFWRRWHMTLGGWFREYVYIPLGGNRVNNLRLFINLFIVWGLTGFWHGADYNFILWGFMFFILISIEKAGLLTFLNKYKIISHCYFIFFIIIGWTLFAITDLGQLKIFLHKMFIFQGDNQWMYYLKNYIIIFSIATLLSLPTIKNIYEKIKKYKLIHIIMMISIFILSVAYLVDSTYNPFLYFRF